MSSKKPRRKYDPLKVKHRLQANSKKIELLLNMEFSPKAVHDYFKNLSETGNKVDPAKVYQLYKGDLGICLYGNRNLINTNLEWNILVTHDFLNTETLKTEKAYIEIRTPEMEYDELRNENSKVKVNRGSGIKSRWKGIQKEINLNREDVPKHLTFSKTTVKIEAQVTFKDQKSYRTFLNEKFLNDLKIA